LILILFLQLEASHSLTSFTGLEIFFILYVFGFSLDEFAQSQEHGFKAYWWDIMNLFDSAWITVFFAYLVIRCYALNTLYRHPDDPEHIGALDFSSDFFTYPNHVTCTQKEASDSPKLHSTFSPAELVYSSHVWRALC
jgi:hypothetical protein